MTALAKPAPVSSRFPPAPVLAARLAWGALLAGLAILAVGKALHPRFTVDLNVYLLAAERFTDGTTLYQAVDGTMPFKYAPAVAWLFVPLAMLPGKGAALVWNLASLGALVWVARLFSSSFALKTQADEVRTLWARVGATFALGQPFFFEMHYGQVDLAMLLLLVLAAHRAEKGSSAWAGLCFALAILLKPPAAIFGLYFLVRRHFRVLVYTVGVGALLWLPVLARYGVGGTLEQVAAWRTIMAATTPPLALQYNAQGLPTVLLGLFYPALSIPPALAMTWAQLGAIGLFLAALWLFRPSKAFFLALLLMGTAWLSPLAWRANYVLAWPLLLIVLSSENVKGRRLAWVLAGLLTVQSVLLHDWILPVRWLRMAMVFRPFALGFLPLFALGLYLGRDSVKATWGRVFSASSRPAVARGASETA